MADEQTGAEEQADAAQGTESETSTEDTSNDGADVEQQYEESNDAKDEESSGDEPPVRKSVKDFIIERKDKKIAKLEGKEASDEGNAPDIRSVIREELAPITSTFAKSADEQELQTALTKYPDAKKMEKTVRKYMANDAYARVPVEFIVRGLLGTREVVKNKADEEARGTRQGGHTRRPTEAKPKTAWDLSDAEFEKQVTKLMSTSAE